MKTLLTFGIGQTPTQSTASDPTVSQRTTILVTSNTQYLRNMVLTDAGLILTKGTVRVLIPTAEIMAAAATLEPTLTYAPIITTEPADQAKLSGAATTFVVVASSELAATYQWKYSADGGSTWINATGGVYSGGTTATLAISDVSSVGSRLYRCTVTNSIGSTNTRSALLTVDIAPTIDIQPGNITAGVGDNATSIVVAISVTTLTYQWQVSTDSGSTYADIVAGAHYTGIITATLGLVSIISEMNGYMFRCVVSNEVSSTTSDAGTLTIV